MGNDGNCEDGSSSIRPGGTAIKLNKDVEFKVKSNRRMSRTKQCFILTLNLLVTSLYNFKNYFH